MTDLAVLIDRAMDTHPIRYVEQAQCAVCNNVLRHERVEGRSAIVSCHACEVILRVPFRILDAEII